jgi:type I restriction enzyme S subunit
MPHSIKITPHGWSITTLGQILLTTASGKTKNWSSDGAYPVHGSTGIIGYTQNPEYKGRAILVARVGANAGKINLADNDYGVTDNTIILKIRESHHTDFIIHLLNQINLNRLVFGSGQPLLTGTQIKQLKISVPPIEEQRAIASALSDMDALLAKLDQLIAKKRDIKQAAMQELLTGRRRLPGFSGGWTVTALRNLGAWKGGATPSMANPDFWVNGDVPWASSGDIKSTTIDATAKNITELAVESSSTTVVPAGSVVMVTRSGILRRYFPVAKTSKPIAINQDIKALIPASGVDTEFVLQSLLLHGPDILSSCMKAGTTVESVELSWLKAYEIDLPSLDEQQAIAALLRDMAAEITALEARREKTRLLKQGMMQELLSGRVRLI